MHSEGYCRLTFGAHAQQGLLQLGLSVCLSVCLCVCPFNVSPLERLFVLKTIPRIQGATKVKKNVGISLKPLCCRDLALPALYGCPPLAIFRYAVKRTCASTRAP